MRPIDRPTKLKPQTDFVHFDNIGGALLVVFQSMTMEGWVDIMYEIQDGDSITMATIYWFFLITFASFFLLNIFLAVIDESFNDTQMKQDEDGNKVRAISGQGETEVSGNANPELTAMALIGGGSAMRNARTWSRGLSLASLGSLDSEKGPWLERNILEPIRSLVENERFADFIMFFIVANTVTMSLEKFPPDLTVLEFLSVCEWVFIIVFSVEMLLFLVAWGPVKYVKNPLSLFDGIIVILSISEKFLSDTAALRAFRGFRLVRVVFKIARRWGSFRVLLKAMIKMMDSLKFFALLFLLVLYVFTLLFLVFFSRKFRFQDEEHAERLVNDESAWCTGPDFPGEENDDCIPRSHFDTFVWAFVTVFQIMSGENWNVVMYDGMRAGGWGVVFFFIFVIIFGQIMILNLFLTILMSKFQEASAALQEEENKKQEDARLKKEKQLTKKNLRLEREKRKEKKATGWLGAVAEVRKAAKDNPNLYKEMQEERKKSRDLSGSTLVVQSVSTYASKEVSDQRPEGSSPRTTSPRPKCRMTVKEVADQVVLGLPGNTEGAPTVDLPSKGVLNGEGAGAADPNLAAHEPTGAQDFLPGQLSTSLDVAEAQQEAGSAAAPVQGREHENTSKTATSLQTISLHTITEPSSPSTMPLRSAAASHLESSPKSEDLETRALLQQTPTRPPATPSAPWLHSTPTSEESLPTKDTSTTSLTSTSSRRRRWPFGYSLFVFSERNCIRKKLRDIVYQKSDDGKMKAFDKFILACIFLSSACMAFDSPLWNPSNLYVRIIRTLDEVFMYIFLVEMVMKLVAQGLAWGENAYLRSGWNWLDGTVVVVSVVGKLDPKNNIGFLKNLRILRAFRPLRAISRYENLKVVVRTIFKSFRELLILGVLTFVFFLVIGILFVSQLNGLFNQCDTEGVGPLASSSFTTPLCLGSGRDSVCTAGFYNKSAPGEWQDVQCQESCAGPQQVAPLQPWRRPTDDTPICVGRCNPQIRLDAGLPQQDICPPQLSSTEQLPKNCDGTLNLDLDDKNNTPEELVGIHYVKGMMMERVLRCGGSEPGSCRDLFCPEGVSDSEKETCRGNCWKHPNFCFETCKDQRNSGSRADVALDSLCGQCLSECEASCHCQDFCTGVIKDAAVCNEQGGKWQPTISQNFNNVFNAFLTLVEISTTEMWLDVMHNAVDGTSHYRQPKRDNQLIWTFAFMMFIFLGNMIILNLGVGVIVENFIAIKESDGGVMLTEAQEAWIKSQKNLFERRLFFPLHNLHLRSPLRRKVFKVIDGKAFEHIIMGAIVLNTGCMMLQIFPEPYDWWEQMVEVGNYTFAVLFTVEFVLKLFALRRNYWQDTWNLFDFFVVVTTLAGILISALSSGEGTGSLGSVVSVIRIFRIARLFRLIRFLKGLNKIFMALLLSVPRLMNVFFLLLLMLILYSILGVQLFARVKYTGSLNDHGNFRNFFWAFVTLFRSMTGEVWNEIMHDLAKDEWDFLRAGSWCSPPDLFDEVNKYEVLQDKCLIDYPNACGVTFAHVLYFVTYIFIVYFIVFNLLIAVILEGYDEGKRADEKELIDECIKLWKKYDPNITMALNYQDTFAFIEEALKLQNEHQFKGGYFRRTIVKNVSSIEHIPMRYARALEHLSVNEEGKIQFLMAVKFVFRLSIAKNDLEILQEIEASDSVLESAGKRENKLLNKLRKLEQRQTSRHGLDSCVSLRAQVAATKIQRFYQERKVERETQRRRLSRNRKKGGYDDCCDSDLREVRADRERRPSKGTSEDAPVRRPSLADAVGAVRVSSKGETSTPIAATDSSGTGTEDARAREGSADAAAEAEAPWVDVQSSEAHLEPRSGAACDGLDVPRHQRRVAGGAERPAEASPESHGAEASPETYGAPFEEQEPEEEPPQPPQPWQEVMVPPVAG